MSDIKGGWVVGTVFGPATSTHEVDALPKLCANCHRHFARGERYSFGQREDADGPGPEAGVGPARVVCRACRPFLTWEELSLIDAATLPGWLTWLVTRWRS